MEITLPFIHKNLYQNYRPAGTSISPYFSPKFGRTERAEPAEQAAKAFRANISHVVQVRFWPKTWSQRSGRSPRSVGPVEGLDAKNTRQVSTQHLHATSSRASPRAFSRGINTHFTLALPKTKIVAPIGTLVLAPTSNAPSHSHFARENPHAHVV